MNTASPAHGTYLLILKSDRRTDLRIGSLGRLVTEPGYYLYIGSAFGPGGIRARLRHHRRVSNRPHWHIDYLRTATELMQAWCIAGVRREHAWARALEKSARMAAPLKGFGSSDCDCCTHLFYTGSKPTRATLQSLLNADLTAVDLSDE